MNWRLVILAAAFSPVAIAAMGQSVTGPVTNAAPSFNLGSGAFSPLPVGGHSYLNWSDLPFTISGTQSVGYNDNVLGLAQGQSNSASTPLRGDLFSTTVFGASTKIYLGQQLFFADGSYGLTRYRVDTADDTHQYSLDIGVNYQVTSRCSGRLVAARNEYQSPIEEQIAAGINTVLNDSANETAKCSLTGYVSGILDSGWSSTQNSNPLDALNDYDSVYLRGGLDYELTGLDTIRALTTVTQRQFTDRGSVLLPVAGLASGTDEIDYQVLYDRVISPKLTFDGMIGITQITINSTAPGAGSPTQYTPVYSASLAWQPTPKLSIGLSSARSVGAPTSTLSNAETTTSQNATLSYILSPKISFQFGIAKSTTAGSSTSNLSNLAIGSGSGITAFSRATYTVTPFLAATASYRYSDRTDLGLDTKDNTFMLSVNYNPH